MGILDRIKNLFKKETKTTGETGPQKADQVKKASVNDYGDTPLGKALTFAEGQLVAKQDKLTNAEVEMFKSKIATYAERVGQDEDEALISVSQLIGGITRA